MSSTLLYQHLEPVTEVSKAQSTDDESSCELKAQKTIKTNLCKYKTQMCKNFSENGYCPYRTKCQFAHGPHQLVQASQNPKKAYRTKKCKSFWEEGTCKYGFRCQFLHYEPELGRQKDFLHTCCAMLAENKMQGKSRLTRILQNSGN